MGPAGSALAGGHSQIVLWGSVVAVATCLLVAFLVFLCSGCDREKKPRQHSGDHENLMNVPSDKEVFSRSVTSLATDAPASSEQNGLLTNGDVLSEDSATTCGRHYEEVQTSASDLLDAQDSAGRPRCHQSRELPRIPADSGHGAAADRGAAGLEGPYEVLKDSASQETVVDDCLYETVKDVKEAAPAPAAPPGRDPAGRPKPAPAGRAPPAPRAPDAADVAEYASVDRNKKCRQSVDVDSVPQNPGDPEEEAPPPVPVKHLDENENLQEEEEERKAREGRAPRGPAPDASKRFSSLSYKSRHEDPTLTEEEISAMYSSVHKPGQSGPKSGQSLKAPESSYACSPGAAQRSPSSCSDLYATVRDFEKTAGSASQLAPAGRPREDSEPDYEAIQTVDREEEKAGPEASGHHGACPRENDYESIGDLQQGRDVTRL